MIRLATLSDAASIAVLSGQLGYPATERDIEERLPKLGHPIFVAVEDDLVVGWIEMLLTFHLTTGARAEISALVVADTHRSRGIGRQLVEHGENWAREQGMAKILVRSNDKRSDAHRFYLREGYERVKTSAVFEKRLK